MTPAVLDINVLLSALIGSRGPSRRVIRAWQADRFTHVTSDHIIAGFVAKLTDPDLLRRFPWLPAAGHDLVPALRTKTTRVPLDASAITPITGDPDDDAVLATAHLGHAAYLVTGDRGLLALGIHAGVRITTPRDFLMVIESDGGGPA